MKGRALLFGFMFLTGLYGSGLERANAVTADDGFDPDINAILVQAVSVQPDGKILVAGTFGTVGGESRNRIVRLNVDGSLDTSFDSGENGAFTLAVQSDGKILAGAGFVSRLHPDGSLDTSFAQDTVSGSIQHIVLQPDGRILVAGLFSERISRLRSDGTLDTTFSANDGTFNTILDGFVHSIAVQPDSKIVIGGPFTSVGGVPRNNLARLHPDGSLDTDFNPDANRGVIVIALQPDGKILIGGEFSTVGGLARNNIARLNPDGSVDADFDPDANQSVESFAIQSDGKILIGGDFSEVGGTSRNRMARLNPDGSLDSDFDPDVRGGPPFDAAAASLSTITLQSDGKILIGGFFAFIGGEARNNIARLYPDGRPDKVFDPNNVVSGSPISSIAFQSDGKILFGGSSVPSFGVPTNLIARLHSDGALDTSLNPLLNGPVYSVAVQPDERILVGGGFTTLDGITRNRLARLNPDGSLDTLFNPNSSGLVFSIAVQPDERILVGGVFTALDGVTRNRLARLNPDGSLDASFDPNANGTVFSIALQPDGRILVGGGFTTIDGTTRNSLARLNSDGSLDTSFNASVSIAALPVVSSIAIQPDGKILVGGVFDAIGEVARSNIARLDPDGGLDTTFAPDANGLVLSIAIQTDGKILVGGLFTTIGGVAVSGASIARLHPDGSLDTSFNAAVGGSNLPFISSIAIQPDGKVLLGGNFTVAGGETRNDLARITNTEAAFQAVRVSGDGRTVRWMRSGASPEVFGVTFEISSDLTTWVSLGRPERIAGGWELTGINIQSGLHQYIRARGLASGGSSSGSGSIIQSIKTLFLPAGADFIPLPLTQESFTPLSVYSPFLGFNPASIQPIGLGAVAGGGDLLGIQIGLNEFEGPVDVYFGFYSPSIDPDNIYILRPDNTFQTLATGLVPWKESTIGPVNENLFGDIPLSALPAGAYQLYLLAEPAGSGLTGGFYLWTNSFVVP